MIQHLVIGGSKGIGYALTRHLLSATKENVHVISRSEPGWVSNPEYVGRYTWYPVDLLSDSDVQDRFLYPLQEFDGFDRITICAGIQERSAPQWTRTQVDKHIQLNYVSIANLLLKMVMQDLLHKPMSGVLLGSFAGDIGSSWAPAYAASKAAIKAFILSLPLKYKKMRWNILYPGRVATPGNPKRSVDEGVPFVEAVEIPPHIMRIHDTETLESTTIDLGVRT